MALTPCEYEKVEATNNAVDISGATSLANAYICPSDGYLRVVTKAGDLTAFPQVGITGSMASDFICGHDIIRHPPIFLKKGFRVYITQNPSSIYSITFISLQ